MITNKEYKILHYIYKQNPTRENLIRKFKLNTIEGKKLGNAIDEYIEIKGNMSNRNTKEFVELNRNGIIIYEEKRRYFIDLLLVIIGVILGIFGVLFSVVN